MYADHMTDLMKRAIEETNRRRAIQEAYNTEHGITPRSIVKQVRDLTDACARRFPTSTFRRMAKSV